jgi:hypothetical protein
MKTLLSSLFGIALSGILFSQNCIQKHIGIYKVDLDRTIEQIRENDPSKANEEPPNKFLEMAKKASLELTENKMSIVNLGPQNPFDFVAKTSDKKGGSCDLVLNIPEETKLPEGVEIPTFTVYEKEDGRIHIQEGSKMSRINDFIWRKIE